MNNLQLCTIVWIDFIFMEQKSDKNIHMCHYKLRLLILEALEMSGKMDVRAAWDSGNLRWELDLPAQPCPPPTPGSLGQAYLTCSLKEET